MRSFAFVHRPSSELIAETLKEKRVKSSLSPGVSNNGHVERSAHVNLFSWDGTGRHRHLFAMTDASARHCLAGSRQGPHFLFLRRERRASWWRGGGGGKAGEAEIRGSPWVSPIGRGLGRETPKRCSLIEDRVDYGKPLLLSSVAVR